jgi:hypothetical protein
MLKRDFVSKIMAAMQPEAFITYQLRRFDMNMATPSPMFYNVIVTALLALGFCVLYEAIAFCLSTAMKGKTSEKSADSRFPVARAWYDNESGPIEVFANSC